MLDLSGEVKERVIRIWENMGKEDRDHFINQVALAMSIWGSDKEGRALVLDVLNEMVKKGSRNLADFGLFVEAAIKNAKNKSKIKRAAIILEGYRIKHALPSEPHMPIV